jgi:Fungal specific transcription factor domain
MKLGPSNLTRLHLSKAVGRLKKNITTAGSTIKDATVASIVSLCVASFVSFDSAAMAVHGNGLREIIRLRGGLNSFRFDPQFMFTIMR